MPDRHDQPAATRLPPLGPLYVKAGINNYEWHVYEGSVRLGTKPTQPVKGAQ
jgi:hypothetical protein